MIYRYKPSEKKHEPRTKKPYRRAGADSPKRLYGYRYDAIDMESLFELSKLEGKTRAQLIKLRIKKTVSQLWLKIKRTAGLVAKAAVITADSVKRGTKNAAARIRAYLEKRKRSQRRTAELSILSGALCAVLLVSAVSAFAACYKLMLADFFGSYEKVTVPAVAGRDYGVAISMIEVDKLKVNVSYEYSPTVPEGRVISQSPDGGVERKIYSNSELPELSLVVSLGKQTSTMKEYTALRARDVKLELKNAGFLVAEREEYSDTVEKGAVISTSPPVGSEIEAGGLAILYVSLGKKVSYVRVPSICGYTEREALKRIISSGLTVGEVVYKSSDEKAGVVITQSPAYNERVKKGAKVNIEISAGREYNTKSVPSLYGLTLAEAKKRLAECGLVAGAVYAAESNEPSGLVISQSPSAGTPIDSAVVSVDMYVSS